jgi:hypothetical protein
VSNHEGHLCETRLKEELGEFTHTCVHESMTKNETWFAKYKIDDLPRWDYSMEDATLIFSEDGKAKVICDMQVVGSTQDDSWGGPGEMSPTHLHAAKKCCE